MHMRIWDIKYLSGLVAGAIGFGCLVTINLAHADAKQNFIRTTNMACAGLGLKQDGKVNCVLNIVHGNPALQLSFDGSERAKAYVAMLVILVGPELCAAVSEDQHAAALTLIDTKSKQMSSYSCDEQAFTGWTKIAKSPIQ